MKPTGRLSTSARVTLTVEVDAGSWGPDCDLAQVYRQAAESATGALRRAIVEGARSYGYRMRIVKVNSVDAITTAMEQR